MRDGKSSERYVADIDDKADEIQTSLKGKHPFKQAQFTTAYKCYSVIVNLLCYPELNATPCQRPRKTKIACNTDDDKCNMIVLAP